MSFLLGHDAREEAKKSIRALAAHSQSAGAEPERLFLVLNTKIHLVKTNDHTPRIIPVTHKLHAVDSKSIALITRDLSYRAHLTKAGAPTEDLFHQIIPFSKVKLMGHSSKALLRLYKENDLVLADTRIHARLPDILGLQFYGKNKKVPFKVQMARQVPGQPKNDACDPKYVRAQVKAIVGNTLFIPPAGGTCIHIVVGYTDWKVSAVLANINDVILYLVDDKYQPVGGLLHKVENLHSVLLKTSDSVALPVMKKAEEHAESDNSDYDF